MHNIRRKPWWKLQALDEISVTDRFASGYKYTALVGTWVAPRASCVGAGDRRRFQVLGEGTGEGFMCCGRGQEKALHHPLIFFFL